MMKKPNGLMVLITLTLLSCNNYFHELIPSDENRILSFSVEGMINRAVISDNTVDAMVNNTSPLAALIPEIKISPMAAILPLTYEYLSAAFPNADILNEAVAVYEARDLSEYVMDLIKRNPNFNVPSLDIPIDFSGPVSFLVISGQGTIRQYTAHVVKDTGEPKILGFGFSKYDNPELIRDAFTSVNHSEKTVNTAVLYPMEMYVSYALIPSFEIMGDRIEIDGEEIQSGIDSIQFTQGLLGIQTKTLTVWRNDQSADYTLTADFSEDPDSIRSIIDFRFYKADNTGIAANAVGSIINNNALGTINMQVFYSGARPSVLTPAFLSPGTVSIAGVTQVSRSSSHDFSQAIEYRVVSRNNLFTRIYTVVVDYIDVASAAPVFTSFKFSSGLNPDLVQDTDSQISDSASLIMITARYGETYPPEMLIPEFRATGLVTVFGSVQTSGLSAQNFSTQIKYTVTNPENTLFKRDYWVQVSFIRDTSSNAIINSFSFHPNENPGLADALEGRIDHNAGTITVFAPVGSGITGRTMIPRFRAAGQVLVNDSVQISGSSGMLFNAPVVYEVVSANGANRKTYTVTVRELLSTIYVNPNAFGMGDGTSWMDAFRELGAACEAAAQFPEDAPKEIWIAAGTYKPSAAGNSAEYFLLAAGTSYIGGFAGNETAKSQRNVAANKVTISGDLGGGVYANNLFGAFNSAAAVMVNGNLSFDGLEFTAANAVNDRKNGAAICARLSGSHELRITGCSFANLQANGGAVYVNGGELVISSAQFEGITSAAYGAVYGTGLSAVKIDNVDLHNINAAGLYFINCSGDMEINNVDLQYIADNGIDIIYGSGKRDFSGINGSNIGGSYGVFVYGGNGDITLTDSDFDACAVSFSSGSFPVRISETTVKNISGSEGIYTSGGTVVIENVVVENITNGTGIYIEYNGSIRISGSAIKDVEAPNGSGLSLVGSGSAVISNNTTIENIEADNGAINANIIGDLTIMDTAINTAAANRGLSLTGSGNTVISNTAINNINTGSEGYAIYASDRRLVIADTVIDNITAKYGVYGTNLTGVGISDLALHDIGYGLHFTNCSGGMEINRVDMHDISEDGIYIFESSGNITISNVDLQNIFNLSVYIDSGDGNITLAESRFNTCGPIFLYRASINISDTEIKNVSTGYYELTTSAGVVLRPGVNQAIRASGENIVIERVNVEDFNEGIQMNATGMGRIVDSSIKNYNRRGGAGIYLGFNRGNVIISGTTMEGIDAGRSDPIESWINTPGYLVISDSIIKNVKGNWGISQLGSGSMTVSGTTIENFEAISDGGGAFYTYGYSSCDLTISNSTIKNAKAPYGGAVYHRSSGSLTISGTTIEDVEATNYGGAIYVDTGTLTIRDSTIKNAKARYGGAIYHNSPGNVTISGTTIEDVEADYGGGIYVDKGTLTIRDSTIKNAKANDAGGGIRYSGSGNLTISGTTIEDVESGAAGGAIYMYTSSGGDLTVRDSTIKNAKVIGGSGGGIYYNSSGSVTISETTIEDVEASNSGGGISVITNVSQFSLTNTTIRNARAGLYGGGIYYLSNTPLVITGSPDSPHRSRFENCRADNAHGAIYASNTSLSHEITNTTFLNCAARNGHKFMRGRGMNFRRCIFEDNDGIYKYDARDSSSPMFGSSGNYYEDCTFTNLTDNYTDINGNQYIFVGEADSYHDPLTLIGCTFNFRSGTAGLCRLTSYSSTYYSSLLMNGVTINDNGGQRPLIRLERDNGPTDTFGFKLTNVYNGTLLNTLTAINALASSSSGVIELVGAVPTLVP